MTQGTFGFGDTVSSPQVKLCECGCGGVAPIATITNKSRGTVKGQPQRFIRGHHSKLAATQLEAERRAETAGAGAKLCECGCGLPAPIATMTRKAKGHVKGQPVRFIAGHKPGRKGPQPWAQKLSVEAGQRIGRSVVLDPEITISCASKPTVRGARLRCKCGTEYERALTVIFRSEREESCRQCLRWADYTGQRFGSLVAIRWVGSKATSDGRRQGCWLCRCDCENEVIVPRVNLRDGNSKSCGCAKYGRGSKLVIGAAAFNKLLGIYQRGARERNLSWELTKEDFRLLTSLNCAYCGTSPARTVRGGPYSGDYQWNGVDRVDSSGPYRLGNVVPACGQCNRSKMDLPLVEWEDWSARFAAFQCGPEMIPAAILAAQLAAQLKAAA